MPPKAGSSRSTATTARPRQHATPKTSRRQFSACGACRTRRVACDLQKIEVPEGEQAVCSECRTRGMNCVDEYAAIKKDTRTLRRGRRIQAVEQLYGRSSHPQAMHSPPSSPRTSSRPSIIPDLDIAFFRSHFFAAFVLQYSLLDQHDFASRYIEHRKGGRQLSIEGQLLAKVLVVWAGSFGVDHTGTEVSATQSTSAGPSTTTITSLGGPAAWRHQQEMDMTTRRIRTDAEVEEILNLIDVHGIMRKPTWDGVRLLLLIWPLTQNVQTQLQRVAMYQTTMSQVYALCSLEEPSTVNSGQGLFGDAMIRARIFLYAHVHEGTTNGLRGTRLALSDDDLMAFHSTLPPLPVKNSESSLPSPVSPTHSSAPRSSSQQDVPQAKLAYSHAIHFFAPMLSLSAICRHIHSVLTGSKARYNMDYFDSKGLHNISEGLERSWDEFELMRTKGLGPSGFSIGSDNLDRFVSSWQIFIFECHYVVRKELEHRVASLSDYSQKTSGSSSSGTTSDSSCSASSLTGSPIQKMRKRRDRALEKCYALLPRVLFLIQRHASPSGAGKSFAYDAGLVKGGCLFAGSMLAKGEWPANRELGMDIETGIQTCVQALHSMRSVYVNGYELANDIMELRNIAANRAPYTSYGYQNQHAAFPYVPSNFPPPIGPPTGASALPFPRTHSTRPSLAPVITTNLADIACRPPHASTSTWCMPSPPHTAHTHRSTPETQDEYPTNMPYYSSSDPSDIFNYSVPAETVVSPSSFELGGVDMAQEDSHCMTSYSTQSSEEFINGVFTVDIAHEQAPANNLLAPPFTAFF